MMFDHAQLATLAAVVRYGSFDAAARAMHVTPSAVSQRIKALEQAAGQVLVRRVRPTRATEAGAVLVRLAGQVDLAEHEARTELGDGGELRLALAVNADSLSTWFPAVVAAMATGPWRVLLDVHRVDQDRTADLLRDGTVMAAVSADASPVQGCRATPLGAMRYLAVAAPGLAERLRPGGTGPVAWHNAALVAFDPHDALQDRFLAGLGVEAPAARHHVPSQDAFVEVLRAGVGWGMVPEPAVGAELAAGVLADLAPGRWLDVPLHWQRWKVDSPVLGDLTAEVRRAARSALIAP